MQIKTWNALVLALPFFAVHGTAAPNMQVEGIGAHNFTNRLYKPIRNGITGDRLNITTCYCRSLEQDRWGILVQADYANYHNGRRYQSREACKDTKLRKGFPLCWNDDIIVDHKIPCDIDEEGNKFCYKRTTDHHFYDNSWDYEHWYYFNDQKRKIEDESAHFLIPPVECEQYCDEFFDGMRVPSDDGSWGAKWGMPIGGLTIWRESKKELFMDLDDMCWNCK